MCALQAASGSHALCPGLGHLVLLCQAFWCSPGITGLTIRICGHGEGLEVPWGLHSFKHCQIPCWSGLWAFFLCSSQFPVIFSCGPGPWCWGAVQEELSLLAAPASTTAAELGACTHPNWEAPGEGVGSFRCSSFLLRSPTDIPVEITPEDVCGRLLGVQMLRPAGLGCFLCPVCGREHQCVQGGL